ncbi:MAG: class I SAM-dependent methyltransferase [Selenomonadaceae bacterium]|nr:class I SAM-dependent methyltransferase [Selenomonadaceae bacterium]MBQ6131475.1 class I SAM-dependent methyltransferase [Selenomonadaceae bacterium]
MIHVNEIPLDFEPRIKILPKIPAVPDEPEMSEFESAFLCGALKTFPPKKILEVGVAGGATTAIILQALEDLGEPYEMYSVDVAEKFYRCDSLQTGFMAMFAKEKILGELRGIHKFHLGKILPQVLDKIGGGIDFVILDTMHILPGEVLDFIAILPYLKVGAVVVLHDVSYHQIKNSSAAATGALFSAVTAEKFLNFDEQALFRYPNIAAFKVNQQTVDNIDNVFLTLILCWKYLPPEEQIVTYRRLYRRFYPVELCEIFQEAIDMNGYNFCLAGRK